MYICKSSVPVSFVMAKHACCKVMVTCTVYTQLALESYLYSAAPSEPVHDFIACVYICSCVLCAFHALVLLAYIMVMTMC